jgi:hypothetical protein
MILLPPATRQNCAQDPSTTIIFAGEETMKIRLVVALAGFAISFALPTFADEKKEINPFPFSPISASPQIVQQLEAINLKFDEAFNKHDAAAVGALYTANAVQVTPVGVFSGRKAPAPPVELKPIALYG